MNHISTQEDIGIHDASYATVFLKTQEAYDFVLPNTQPEDVQKLPYDQYLQTIGNGLIRAGFLTIADELSTSRAKSLEHAQALYGDIAESDHAAQRGRLVIANSLRAKNTPTPLGLLSAGRNLVTIGQNLPALVRNSVFDPINYRHITDVGYPDGTPDPFTEAATIEETEFSIPYSGRTNRTFDIRSGSRYPSTHYLVGERTFRAQLTVGRDEHDPSNVAAIRLSSSSKVSHGDKTTIDPRTHPFSITFTYDKLVAQAAGQIERRPGV